MSYQYDYAKIRVINGFCIIKTNRITMQPYGVEFRNFFAKSDSPVFQKLARLIDFVPTIEIGQREAVKRK